MKVITQIKTVAIATICPMNSYVILKHPHEVILLKSPKLIYRFRNKEIILKCYLSTRNLLNKALV